MKLLMRIKRDVAAGQRLDPRLVETFNMFNNKALALPRGVRAHAFTAVLSSDQNP
jgi:hypothetical protein